MKIGRKKISPRRTFTGHCRGGCWVGVSGRGDGGHRDLFVNRLDSRRATEHVTRIPDGGPGGSGSGLGHDQRHLLCLQAEQRIRHEGIQTLPDTDVVHDGKTVRGLVR